MRQRLFLRTLVAVFLGSLWALAQPPEAQPELTPEQKQLRADAAMWAKKTAFMRNKGKLQEGIQAAEKLLATEVKLYGELHANPIHSRKQIGEMQESAGKFDASKETWQKVLELQTQRLGKDHWQVTDIRVKLQTLEVVSKLDAAGRTELALADSREREALVEQRKNSNYQATERLFLQTKAIRQRLLGEDHPDYATSLSHLVGLYLGEMGQPAKAEPLLLQAKAIRQKALGENHPDYAESLSQLATFYRAVGQLGKVEPLLLQAKAIRQKAHGEDHLLYARCLNSLAVLYQQMDQPAKAEPLVLQAKAIQQKALGENNRYYARSSNLLAGVYIAMGQFEKAELLLLQAKAIQQRVFGENHFRYAGSLGSLASVYQKMGQPAKAEPLLLQAKDIRQKVFGESHPGYALTLSKLAGLYAAMGQPAKAEPLHLQAVNIIIAYLERTAEVQTEAGQLLMAQKYRFYWENLLSGTASTASTAVYEPLFRIRGAVTARQTFLRTLRQTTPEVKPLVEELQANAREMSRLVNAPPDPKQSTDLAQQLDALTVRHERLQRELAAKSDAFAAYQRKKKGTPADLQKLLPADAVLIDFLGYKDRLCAFVITPRQITRIELGAMKPIAEAIDQFREQLTRREPLTGKPDDPALVLREKLWKPLTPAIGTAKLVLLSPDGALCRLPFAALPNADGSKYLIEELALAVMPVPQQMVDLFTQRPAKKAAPSLLTMGDIDFEQMAIKEPEKPMFVCRRAGGAMQWSALPATRAEVVAIADSFKTAVPEGTLASLRGAQATQSALREQMGRHEFVHLATHGYFSPKELTAKWKSTDDLDDDLDDDLNDGSRPVGLNPGLLSGIVCAGANKPTEANDGVLTALEISELDLSKVELAILSACETGLGETAGGEGVLGLQRAFQLAGARTTVTSLWKVSDNATQKLMTRYYENYFGKNMSTLEALRESQRWMLQEGITRGMVAVPDEGDAKAKRSPPIFWAAFSLAGDWR